MTSFSIIIVTWNGKHHLQRFLPSVVATRYSDFEIIIADNCSDDGTVEWINEQFPSVRVVQLDKNYGYCGGNNKASAFAQNDILVFLNNDAGTHPEWLVHAERSFDNDKNIVALQPKILSAENPSAFEYAGAAGGYLDLYGYPFCRGRVFDSVENDNGQYNQAGPIFWASGAAMFVRREIFEKLGGFAETFQFHMEEIDLCWRIQSTGGTVWYCPESIVYHLGGGSLNSENPRKVYFNFRNNLLMLVRNHPSSGLFRTLLTRIILDKVAMAHFLIKRKPRHAFAIVKALFSFMKMLPEALKSRRNHKVDSPLVVELSSFSVVYQYFGKKRKLYSELPET